MEVLPCEEMDVTDIGSIVQRRVVWEEAEQAKATRFTGVATFGVDRGPDRSRA